MKRIVPRFAIRLGLALALTPPWCHAEIVDRIVVTIGKRVITLSEVQEAHRVECLLNQKPVESLEGPRLREVAVRLVDQALLEMEMESSRIPGVPREEIESRIAAIRKSFGNNGDFLRVLRQYELAEERVRKRVELQANILRFIDLRFRPGVQVDEPAIELYYREKLLPELRARGAVEVPDLEKVREQIEEVLVQERVNQQYAAWLNDLRRQAAVLFR